jgi:tetratricopeptide (TPR) repeat protein
MDKSLELVVTTGNAAGKRFPLAAGGLLRLGRSSSNDICITDEELSRNHCMFETKQPGETSVIDLASANGTFVNGVQLGQSAQPLKAGDEIEVGATHIRVVCEGEAVPQDASSIDLGLDAPGAAAPEPPPLSTRRKVANAMWALAALLAAAAAALVLLAPRGAPAPAEGRARAPRSGAGVVSLAYEKVDADQTHIFRYRADVGADGAVKVVSDDIPGEKRRIEKEQKLSDLAKDELRRIFSLDEWRSLEPSYSGPDASGENKLLSARIRVVSGDSVKECSVVNTVEPKGFRYVRESLETLLNNELGLHSAQRSREELVRSSAASEEVGDAKWNERDVEYGNLSEAIRHYKAAKNDLATVGDALDATRRLQRKIDEAEADLKSRYDAVRFEAERARQIGDWQRAIDEFRKLREMIPQKDDPRNAEASANLLDMEKRLEFSKKKNKEGKRK